MTGFLTILAVFALAFSFYETGRYRGKSDAYDEFIVYLDELLGR